MHKCIATRSSSAIIFRNARIPENERSLEYCTYGFLYNAASSRDPNLFDFNTLNVHHPKITRCIRKHATVWMDREMPHSRCREASTLVEASVALSPAWDGILRSGQVRQRNPTPNPSQTTEHPKPAPRQSDATQRRPITDKKISYLLYLQQIRPDPRHLAPHRMLSTYKEATLMDHTPQHPLLGYPAEPMQNPRIHNPIPSSALGGAKPFKNSVLPKKNVFAFQNLKSLRDCSSEANLI